MSSRSAKWRALTDPRLTEWRYCVQRRAISRIDRGRRVPFDFDILECAYPDQHGPMFNRLDFRHGMAERHARAIRAGDDETIRLLLTADEHNKTSVRKGVFGSSDERERVSGNRHGRPCAGRADLSTKPVSP